MSLCCKVRKVVRDGNLFTGGGVTAGIDFGFVLLAELSSRDYAASVQLSLEYNPMPPHKVDERSKV
jgi:cyclohexyl-isocyanide hydratase